MRTLPSRAIFVALLTAGAITLSSCTDEGIESHPKVLSSAEAAPGLTLTQTNLDQEEHAAGRALATRYPLASAGFDVIAQSPLLTQAFFDHCALPTPATSCCA
jgi:hypothetical protein